MMRRVVRLAAEAGCWYVYQAIIDTSPVIAGRIKRLQEHGIGVEGTILLGTDDQDEEYIRRLVDFLMGINLDVAEFTILTPFPHTPLREQLAKEKRILQQQLDRLHTDKVVYQPKQMTPAKLQELFHYAWDTFYADGGYQIKMGTLFKKNHRPERWLTAPTNVMIPKNRVTSSVTLRSTHEPGSPDLDQPGDRPLRRLSTGYGGCGQRFKPSRSPGSNNLICWRRKMAQKNLKKGFPKRDNCQTQSRFYMYFTTQHRQHRLF